jgi:ketosteroid isomerase-like protein
MSDANVKIVQDAYAAFQRGDIQSILNLLSDDIVWTTPGEGLIPQGGTHRGKSAVANFFATVGQTLQFSKFEPQTFIAQGDHVVALGKYAATVKQTGRTCQADWSMAFSFKGNKIARFQEYTDTAAIAEAYAAAKAA